MDASGMGDSGPTGPIGPCGPVLSARSGGASEMRWCRKYHAGVSLANNKWNADMSGVFLRRLEPLNHKGSQNNVSDWNRQLTIDSDTLVVRWNCFC